MQLIDRSDAGPGWQSLIDLGLVGAVSSWHVVVRAGLCRQSMIGVGWWALLRLGWLSLHHFRKLAMDMVAWILQERFVELWSLIVYDKWRSCYALWLMLGSFLTARMCGGSEFGSLLEAVCVFA